MVAAGDDHDQHDGADATASAPSARPADLEPAEPLPSVIGRYRPTRIVADGRLATVFAAPHPDRADGTEVAIKLIKPGRSGSPTAVARLVAEGETMRRVRSPHVIEFVDSGRWDDRPYLVMALADGGSLDARLVAGVRSDPWNAARIADQLAHALTPLHDLGLLHGDVHPANLLIVSDGVVEEHVLDGDEAETAGSRLLDDCERIVLCDLELVVDLAHPALTKRPKGAPRYAAPELHDPDVPITLAADVHAAAAVMWAVISGANPPRSHEVPAAVDGLSPWWREVFAAGLHSDPARRPTSVRRLADAVIAAIDVDLERAGLDPIQR